MNPFNYDTVWLAIALSLLAPAIFVALCRQALGRYSRKLLLGKVPPERHESLEESLSRRDEYQVSLERLDFFLRLGVAFSLAFGRFLKLGDGLSLPDQFLSVAILVGEVLLVMVLFVGLLPSVLAGAWAEAWVLRLLPVIERLHQAFAPARRLSRKVIGIGALLLAGRRQRSTHDIVEEEILNVMEEGEREGILESRDIDMIESIISFGDVKVSEVMTPRTEMVCLDLTESKDVNLQRAIDCGHSRIPVVRQSKDNVVGLLYVKDLLERLYRKEDFTLESVMREPYLVPRTKKIQELLQEFKNHRRHIAIVQDEQGGTAGLITIEDIIEEIVGEIGEEYPKEEPAAAIERFADGLVEVDASIHIDDFNDEFGLQIPEGESYDTLGGFLFSSLGRVPAVGYTRELNGIRLEVTEADERRVHRLRVHLGGQKGGG